MARPLASLLALTLALAWALGPASAETAPAPRETVRYRLGLLARGPGYTPGRSAHTDSIQAGHMANIGAMAQSGILLAAGPFAGGGDLRGIFVFRPGEDDGLDTLLLHDPAIASGRLECRLHTWIAPSGIGDDYRRRAQANGKLGEGRPDSMVTHAWVMLRRGPRYTSNMVPGLEKLLARQAEYAEQLERDGKLLFKGAIEGTGDLRGIYVMSGDSATVMRLVSRDPAVRAGRFKPELLRWWTAWGTIPGH